MSLLGNGLQLFIYCTVMFFGSFMAGSSPLCIPKMSQTNMRRVSIFGAGLLVGTAFIVIIPEGIETLNMSSESGLVEEGGRHKKDVGPYIGVSLIFGFLFMLLVDQWAAWKMTQQSKQKSAFGQKIENYLDYISSRMPLRVRQFFDLTPDYMVTAADVDVIDADEGEEGSSERLLNSSSSTPSPSHINWTTTLGLVVHAAADGIALGASALTNQAEVEIIVFIAIMLHKAPAAFGLVSFLLHEGASRSSSRKHLFIFSISAPLMALLTYTTLSLLSTGDGVTHIDVSHIKPSVERTLHNPTEEGASNIGKFSGKGMYVIHKDNSKGNPSKLQALADAGMTVSQDELAASSSVSSSDPYFSLFSTLGATGVAMLFSAGTFVYVATIHVLPEILNSAAQTTTTSSDLESSSPVKKENNKTLPKADLGCLIGGCLLPLLLNVFHHH